MSKNKTPIYQIKITLRHIGLGGDFDPEAFDLDGINEALKHFR